MTDPAVAWLKANDPEASTPGYDDRYSAVPRRERGVITAEALDRVVDGKTLTWADREAWMSRRGGKVLMTELYDDDDEHGAGAYAPKELQGIATPPRAPARPFREALAKRLTVAELDHLGRIEHGDRQQDIADHLGISQPAVAKRERRLLGKVNAIHLEATGRPYPGATRRRSGVRGRKVP